MNILVDADACPVKNIITKIAKEYSLPVVMIIDNSHVLNDNYSEVVVVDKARDSVDIALINRAARGDLVVTQDYGVAAMAISKGCYAISNHGLIFDKHNIDRLLFERHLSQKIRKSGGRTFHPKKRTHNDDLHFENQFKNLIKKILKHKEEY